MNENKKKTQVLSDEIEKNDIKNILFGNIHYMKVKVRKIFRESKNQKHELCKCFLSCLLNGQIDVCFCLDDYD